MQRFEQVSQKISFPELERASSRSGASGRRVRPEPSRCGGTYPLWVFYEGPPTANGTPGIHHVEARVFKDVYPRFKTMTGHFVPRKGGWDCHGLPVELEVEKEIGTTGKRDIEAFGIAEFNRLCRESVTRYVGEFERLTDRIGFWIDMSDAYWTSEHRLHRVGLVVAEAAARARPARRVRQGHGVLPAVRHRLRRRRSPWATRRSRTPACTSGSAAGSAIPGLADSSRGLPPRVDHHTVDRLPSNEGLAVDDAHPRTSVVAT